MISAGEMVSLMSTCCLPYMFQVAYVCWPFVMPSVWEVPQYNVCELQPPVCWCAICYWTLQSKRNTNVIVKRHEYYAVAENVVVLPFLKVKKALNNFIQTDLWWFTCVCSWYRVTYHIPVCTLFCPLLHYVAVYQLLNCCHLLSTLHQGLLSLPSLRGR